MKIKFCVAFFAAILWCAQLAVAASAPMQHIVTVDDHPISVWSRAPANPKFSILLVHGRTWSALPDFDLQVPKHNRSVMQALVKLGYATYAIDLRGYGSTPRNKNGWSTPNEAANDVAQVLKFIHRRHPQLAKPVLFGWSMGSVVSHLTAQLYPETMSDLILYGYPRDPAANPQVPLTSIEPPREVNTRERAMSDFISPSVISKDAIEAYVVAALKTDPVRADWNKLDEYSVLNPQKVKAPTLLMHGERDPLAPIDAQSRVFVGLGNPDKQWVILAGGDHAAMLEDSHDAFIAAVKAFVERPRTRRETRDTGRGQ